MTVIPYSSGPDSMQEWSSDVQKDINLREYYQTTWSSLPLKKMTTPSQIYSLAVLEPVPRYSLRG